MRQVMSVAKRLVIGAVPACHASNAARTTARLPFGSIQLSLFGTLREDERVADIAFGDVPVPAHGESLVGEPREVRIGVGVVPEHGCTQIVLDARPLRVPDDHEEEAAGAQRGEEAWDEVPLVAERDVDQCIEADDRVEVLGLEREVDDVAAHEGRLGHKPRAGRSGLRRCRRR